MAISSLCRSLHKILLITIITVTSQGCALFSAAGLSSQGQPTKQITTLSETYTAQQIVDHSIWDQLLKEYVDDRGFVDYKGFSEDRGRLQEYLILLSETEPRETWSGEELLAYYINSYNAYTVQLIVDNYPVKSIKDINGPWTRALVPIGTKNLSLGGIENGILRKMNEPRIHFAINCASVSCPKLLNEAFIPGKIDQQLEKVTWDFINGDKNELDPSSPRLSRIFDWYRKDFVVDGKVDIIAYINSYSDVKLNSDATIDYLEYDWNLNESR